MLRWPDWSLGDQFAKGFAVVGNVPRSNVFREVQPKAEQTEQELLADADEWNASLESDTKQSPMDEAI